MNRSPITRVSGLAGGLGISLALALVLAGPSHAEGAGQAASGDALASGFSDPPASARPRVWWHWMNGNISKDGIAKDLAWMKRIGIAGMQNFDANIGTPQVVDKRLVYMTPEWKDAFRFAAEQAKALDLELAIAASPGWSETGGPWVRPEDGMKKIVWSEAEIRGGRRFAGKLPELPRTPGPYQDVPRNGQFGNNDKDLAIPVASGDIAVFAYRLTAPDLPVPGLTNNGAALADAALVTDGSLATRAKVATGTEQAPGTLEIHYDAPQTIRSATIYVPGQAQTFNDAALLPRLEVKEGEAWRALAEVPLTSAATTVGFPAVTARDFRIVFAPNLRPDRMGITVRRHPRSVPVAEVQLSGDPRVDQFETKSGLAIEKDYYAMVNGGNGSESGLAPGQVLDLTSHLRADGSLDWTPPKGRWRVVRMGWSLTGTVNHPAPAEATGLEVDKYDGKAVRRYLDTYLGMYRSATGKDLMGAQGLQAILTDSTEIGTANWTPEMVARFRERRGYDPTPWLPALAGILVGTRAETDAFLYDYRRTLADLQAGQHYGTLATVAHENGLKVYSEALESRRPILGDDMAMRSHADVPMAAIWTYPKDKGPAVHYLADMKGASSVAHVYGQNLAATESLTSNSQFWAHAPSDLKRVIDLAFATGINRPIIHTSVHQPVDDKVPGLSLAIFGQFFNRHESWAEMAKPWVDYMSRSAFLLQQGRNVADVAYFYGEERPLTELFGTQPVSDAPKRHAYDFLNADALLDAVSVENGEIVTRGGARYRAIYLGGTSGRMTLPVLRKLASLVEAGATIVGNAPLSSPSLADDPKTFAELRARLWTGDAGKSVGKGRVIAGGDIEAALAQIGVAPDFRWSGSAPDSEILFVHRAFAGGDIYFLNNRKDRPETIEAHFRITGKRPEIWHAETGRSEPVSYRIEGGETIVPLSIAPEDAFFVVFRDPATAPSATIAHPDPVEVGTLAKGWSVSFQPDRGAPAGTIALPALVSLSESQDAGIRYFSGIATYTTQFRLPGPARPGAPLWLDLGRIGDLAEVSVNGTVVGTAWHASYRLDIGPALRRGNNSLQVRVANLWVNRLIGDAQPDANKITWTSVRSYGATASLRPSGLIGPVRFYTTGQ